MAGAHSEFYMAIEAVFKNWTALQVGSNHVCVSPKTTVPE